MKILVLSALLVSGTLHADRTVLAADGQDLAFITVEAVDKDGRLQLNADQKVQFTVSGAGVIAAVGNGNGQAEESYSGNTFNLFQGRALVVLRTMRKPGPISLTSTADGLTPSSLVVESKFALQSSELR